MKGKRLKLCGRLVFALLLLQIIGFTGGKLQVSARADDENVITKEYHGFTCKIINEEELIVSGEGILDYECNGLREESNSNGMKYGCVTFKSITFDEGIEGITSSCSLNNAEYINLPASCTEIDTYFWKYALNRTVNLSPENTQYTLEDGVVYSKDKSELIKATPKEYEIFTIPATVEKIQSGAFRGCKIKDLYFADNGKLTELGSNAFRTYSSCAVETVHIPNYIEVIGSNNFNYDTNIIIEEGSQLKSICSVSGYGDISFLKNQITDVSFLKNAKKLKNLYINYANLSNESIEVLNELEELEEIHVVNGSGNLSDYFFKDNNGKKYMVNQENRVLLCDSEYTKAGDESVMDGTTTDITPTGSADFDSTMPILKTDIRTYAEYKGYHDYIKLKDGNLYSNGVIIMTNVVDFVKFHTESHNDFLLIIRTDGTLWTLNYYEYGEEAVPIKVYSFYEEEKTKMGDANGDGKINVKDSAMLKRYLAGWDVKMDLKTADIDGDGNITIKDSALLKRYLAGWSVDAISNP